MLIKQDAITREIYSKDASIFSITPSFVAFPKNEDQVQEAIFFAKKRNLPVHARGAATGTTGGALGEGVVVDLSRYLKEILTIDIPSETATVQAGVIQDELNEALRPYGYRLGPDTSTGNVATLGGMLMNNAAGTKSLLFGSMRDHIEGLRLATTKGILLIDPSFRELDAFTATYRSLIEKHLPKLPRKSSGYLLDALLETPYNPAKAIAGSEGTLGIATTMRVKIVKIPLMKQAFAISFDTMEEAMCSAEEILSYAPSSYELIDDKILSAGKASSYLKKELSFLTKTPKALCLLEFDREVSLPFKNLQILDEGSLSSLLLLRKRGLGLLQSRRSYERAQAFIEDLSIPPSRLPSFIQKLTKLLKRAGKECGIYGHIGAGCLHIRPFMDLRDEKDVLLMQKMMLDALDIVKEEGGVMSGEHGDGLIRSFTNDLFFGKEVMEAFLAFKNLFDPEHLMNPGKIVSSPGFSPELRTKSKTAPSISTFFSYEKEGGFPLMLDLCNGNGLCRKKSEIMCPSFQATGEEKDSTRGRANFLTSLLKEGQKMFESKEGMEILDLCLQCKGCQLECPSSVDMAKIKAEFTFGYYKKNRRPLSDYAFAFFPKLAKVFSFAPSIFHFFSKLSPLFGIASGIKLAERPFSKQIGSIKQPSCSLEVALFVDTFTEYIQPEHGMLFVRLCNRLGYRVKIVGGLCCGRTYLSKGFLEEAKREAEKAFDALEKVSDIPLVVLEPSCRSLFRDEFFEFCGKTKNALSFEEWLSLMKPEGAFSPSEKEVLTFDHCHTRAKKEPEVLMKALSIAGYKNIKNIEAGCCGMAGSFGYEKNHVAISKQIAELALIPAIEKHPKALLCFTGLSCRQQVWRCLGREARHPLELAFMNLK